MPGATRPAFTRYQRSSHYHGSSRPSLVKVPVGPPLGRVTAHTTLAAPWATDRPLPRPAPPRPPSPLVQPGQTAFTRTPSLNSSPASILVSAFSAALETL